VGGAWKQQTIGVTFGDGGSVSDLAPFNMKIASGS
jgi:hypothetical protein